MVAAKIPETEKRKLVFENQALIKEGSTTVTTTAKARPYESTDLEEGRCPPSHRL